MPKNLGLYNDNLSVPRKQDIDAVASRVSTSEDNIAMLDSDMEAAQGDITTLKGNVTTLTNALGSKQDKIAGGASTITDDNLTANRALVSNGSGKVAVSAVTATELGYLDGVTSNVQTQLNKKLESAPVTSVNTKTGAVVLTATDVGAVAASDVTQTLGTSTTKVPSEKAVSDAIVAAGGGSGGSGVNSVNGKTGDVVLNAADVGALPNTTVIPSKTSQLTNDSGFITDKELADKVSKSGDTMTGKLTVPQVETGAGNSNFFQCRKFRGEGDANTYYHAIDFGYRNHDQVDFHEYGGIWNFFKNTSGKANEGSLCGKITTNGWEGNAKLTGSPTAPTPGTSDNSTRIATTAFVHGLVDNVPTVPSTTNILKGNGSGGVVAATRGSDYIASGNIVKQTLVSTESTPTENYAINWVYG